MASKRTNSLRDYHLLVTRQPDGFEWQIRYDRHANPLKRSDKPFPSQSEAATSGEAALAALKREITADIGKAEADPFTKPAGGAA